MAALVYVLATVGFSGGIIFYDALIVSVSPPDRYDEVSCFGFSLGYIGGGILFAVNVAMTLSPPPRRSGCRVRPKRCASPS